MARGILLAALLFVPAAAPAAPAAVPFHPGEKTSYSITYFGATAGVLDLEVLPPTEENGRKRTELSAKARTDSIFSLFYRFQNLYRSTVDPLTGLPLRFLITHDETKHGGTVALEFDQAKKQVRYRDRREDRKTGAKLEKDSQHAVPAGTHDVVSVFFHARALPLEVGKKFDVPVFIGEESHLLRLEVEREEELPTKLGDFDTWVLRPSVLKDGQVKEVPETFLWIAKDKHRALVKLKAKVKIGSVVAYLRSYEEGKAPPAPKSK